MLPALRLALIASFGLCAGVAAQDIPRGEIVDRVVSRDDDAQSYALYLPSSYDPAGTWPVIYCFDPAARGRDPRRAHSFIRSAVAGTSLISWLGLGPTPR